jgi:hypothetical protein
MTGSGVVLVRSPGAKDTQGVRGTRLTEREGGGGGDGYDETGLGGGLKAEAARVLREWKGGRGGGGRERGAGGGEREREREVY